MTAIESSPISVDMPGATVYKDVPNNSDSRAGRMRRNVMRIVGRGSEYHVPPTQYHPDHRVGEFTVEGGIVWDVTTSPDPGSSKDDAGTRVHLKRTYTNTGEYTRADFVLPEREGKDIFGVVVSGRDKAGRSVNLDIADAFSAADALTEDFGELNGGVIRVRNHRGQVYPQEEEE